MIALFPNAVHRGALLLVALGLFAALPASASSASFDADDRAETIAYLTDTAERFLALADGLTAEQLQFKPAPERWSVAEIADHLVKAEEEVRRRLHEEIGPSEPRPEWRDGVPKTSDRAIRLALTNRIEERFNAPPFLQPEAAAAPGPEALRQFEAARRETLELARTTTLELRDLYGAHPLFGEIDGVQWLIFLGAHVERHRLQAEEVIAAAGFPSAPPQAATPSGERRSDPASAFVMADRDEEIRLARTAAPEHVSADATIYVMTERGYDLAVEGANPFVCLVLRGFTGPLANPDFWNPDVRGPVCYNAVATRSALPADRLRTRLALAGQTKTELASAQADAFRRGELQPPAAGAMAFMQSPEQLLGSQIGAWRPHLMIYLPHGAYDDWGARPQGAPAIPFDGDGEPLTTVVIPLPTWSDGTSAPVP